MEDSNTAKTTQVEPKTFMQRFLEIEQIVVSHDERLADANNAFTLAAKLLESTLTHVKELSDQLHAVYILSEEGAKISRTAVVDKMRDLEVAKMKSLIEKDVKDGILKPIESITSPDDIVVFSSNELAYGHYAVSQFKSEELKQELMGKKVGDQTKDITIEGIYTIAQQEGNNGQSAE
jgi:hypothetical protein